MRITRLRLENWRNFHESDAPLEQRVFLVGPNAAGKSNFLDAIRFLRDVADPQGGFQRAVGTRGGVAQIRSLHGHRPPHVALEVEVDLGDGAPWKYRLEFTRDSQRRPIVKTEVVTHGGKLLRERPNKADKNDPDLLSQTHLEQVNTNRPFRELADFFSRIRYLHLVPQLVREPDRSKGRVDDPFGGDFLKQLARVPPKTRNSRLKRITSALRVAVPQLQELNLKRDEQGVPHLRVRHRHWRPGAVAQNETQLSDGTLRLLGLLWALLDGTAPLLLEEPELSVHTAIVRHIPQMLARLNHKNNRQVIISTHSAELLADEGIGGEEVLVLTPHKAGTQVEVAGAIEPIRALLDGGLTVADAVIPRTAPRGSKQLTWLGGPL
ncbi:AAA family ATPase [Corallococcus llansteffanensis]|uniref:Chromosome segregation protein SMC n=1 Tax=Corallococcus llansteffanensis TaxID=2316731 RepID=A0A3A8NZJ7_9BACT|nr:ATP-binding protein [Corallococcus llansteffanensis]RKH49638.1 chromosome segregation protein SMC [Corallococcus llansteffanensis]